jgi:uncharacterized protein YndB with AHSA1/START domain
MTTELTVRRTLPAPADRVWRALTEPKALAAWFWPERYETTAEVDLRTGGRYRIEGKPTAVSGEYLDVDPVTRLAFTWRWDGEEHESLVTMTLSETGDGGTELVVVHARLPEADVANHAQGWNDCLDRLPGYLESAP